MRTKTSEGGVSHGIAESRDASDEPGRVCGTRKGVEDADVDYMCPHALDLSWLCNSFGYNLSASEGPGYTHRNSQTCRTDGRRPPPRD